MIQPTETDAVLGGNISAIPGFPLLELANEKLKGTGFQIQLGINVSLEKHKNGNIYFNAAKPKAVFQLVEIEKGKPAIVAQDSDWFQFLAAVEHELGARWMKQTGFHQLKHENDRG